MTYCTRQTVLYTLELNIQYTVQYVEEGAHSTV
jgi:hypothetical protein